MIAINVCLWISSWLAPVAAFDLMPPGSRPVTHTLRIERSAHFDTYDFFAAPIAGFSGSTRIEPGVPFEFSSKYGTRVYVLDKGAALPDVRNTPQSLRETYTAAARAVGTIPVGETSHVSIASPVESVDTLLRVEDIADGVLRLGVVEHHETWGKLHGLVIGALVLGGAAGLVVLARRRRNPGAPAVS